MGKYETIKTVLPRISYKAYCFEVHRGAWRPARHLDLICTSLQDIEQGNLKRLMIFMPPRHGKLLADSTEVLTTKGWKTHGDLTTDDFVYGLDGNPTRIIGVSPSAMAEYEVEFTNGEKILCHARHEWTVYSRSHGKMMTVETQWLAKKALWMGNKGIRGSRAVYQLPHTSSTINNDIELPIDPYVLGVWLGDGSTGKPNITMSEEDSQFVIPRFIKRGYDLVNKWVHKDTGVPTFSFAGEIKSRKYLGRLTRELKNTNVIRDKRIPDIYMVSSIEQRLMLLAGLIDTDGSVEADSGRVRFITANAKLADDVYSLCSTLGFKPYITIQDNSKYNTEDKTIINRQLIYVVGFQPTVQIPTAVPRKQHFIKSIDRKIGIVSITKTKYPENGKCIQVDREDGLYLVGRSMIPTHNSTSVSETFPSYFIARNPDRRVIEVSYGDELAQKFGYANRRKIEEFGSKYFGINVDRYNASKTNWGIEDKRGGMISAGIGGSITGEGADLLLIDDPIKNREQADSETYREKIWSEWQNTLLTRLHPGASVIIILTRWHPDDLAGRLLAHEPDNWKVISLPAEAEEDNDSLGRIKGQALWPEHGYNEEWIAETKDRVGSYTWASLYQQRPRPLDADSMFKREFFEIVDSYPMDGKAVRYWDLAATEPKKGKDPDYTVGVKMVEKKGQFWVVDIVRVRTSSKNVEDVVRQTAYMDGKTVKIFMEEEPGSSGKAVCEHYKREVLKGFPFWSKKATGDKVTRSLPFSAACEARNVRLVYGAWNQKYLDELIMFPVSGAGIHDDQVDASSGAHEMLTTGAGNINILDYYKLKKEKEAKIV